MPQKATLNRGGLQRDETLQALLGALGTIESNPWSQAGVTAKNAILLGLQQPRQVQNPAEAMKAIKDLQRTHGKNVKIQVTQDASGADVFSAILPDTKKNRAKAKKAKSRGQNVQFAPGPIGQFGGGVTPAQRLINETQKAQDAAKKANEERFEEIKAGRLKFLEAQLKGIEGMGKSQKSEILRREKSSIGAAKQDLVSRGLTGTTILPGEVRAHKESTNRSLMQLSDYLLNQKLNALRGGSEQYLSFLERREDVGPDLGQLADLAQASGEFGAGLATGPPPTLGATRRGAGGEAPAPLPAPQSPGAGLVGPGVRGAGGAGFAAGGTISPQEQQRREQPGGFWDTLGQRSQELDEIQETKILRRLPPGQKPPSQSQQGPLPPGTSWVQQGNQWVLMQQPSDATRFQQDLDNLFQGQDSGSFGGILDQFFGGGGTSGATLSDSKRREMAELAQKQRDFFARKKRETEEAVMDPFSAGGDIQGPTDTIFTARSLGQAPASTAAPGGTQGFRAPGPLPIPGGQTGPAFPRDPYVPGGSLPPAPGGRPAPIARTTPLPGRPFPSRLGQPGPISSLQARQIKGNFNQGGFTGQIGTLGQNKRRRPIHPRRGPGSGPIRNPNIF